MLISFFRLLKIAFQNFYRNIWLSLVTLTIIILALLSINILVILNIFTDFAIEQVKDKIDISIYLKSNVNEDQAYAIKSKIESIPEVKEIIYTTAEEALKNFKKRHENDLTLLESLDELENNPLGITFVVKAGDSNDYQKILAQIEGREFDEYSNWITDKDFNNYKIIIEKLNSIAGKIRAVGYIASGILLFITILIIFNSIRVAIYTHHEEIGIMRLVGAASSFIIGPFLAESIMYALISWLAVLIIIYSSLSIIQPYIASFIGATYGFNLTAYYKSHFFQIFAWQLLLIIAISIISSCIAIRKYLRS